MNISILMLFSALLVVGCNNSNSKKSIPPKEETSQSASPADSSTRTEVSHDLINHTSSKVTFDEAQNIYLVSPPPVEKIIIKDPRSITANIGFCFEMKMIKFYSEQVLYYKNELAKAGVSLIERVKHKSSIEDDLKLRRNTLSAQQIQSLEKEIILVSYQIKDLKADQARFTKHLESSQSSHKKVHEILMFEGSMAEVKLESDFEKNIDQLEQDNPHLTFEAGTLLSKIPVRFKAQGLESFPAEDMILGLKKHIGLFEEGGQMFIADYLGDLQGTVRLSLYGACALASGKSAGLAGSMEEIVIDVEYGE